MQLPDFIQGLLVPLVPALVATGVGFFLPRKTTHGWGVTLGKAASRLLRQKLGRRGGEKVENRLQTTLGDFISGIMEGLDEDDAEAR